MSPTGEAPRHGMLQSAVDAFVSRTHAMADLVANAGNAGTRAVVPEPVLTSATHLLASLRNLAEQAPQVTDELGVLVQELHAKRQSIQALQSELAVLDRQLEILEEALAPLEAWNDQWNRLRHSILSTVHVPREEQEQQPVG